MCLCIPKNQFRIKRGIPDDYVSRKTATQTVSTLSVKDPGTWTVAGGGYYIYLSGNTVDPPPNTATLGSRDWQKYGGIGKTGIKGVIYLN